MSRENWIFLWSSFIYAVFLCMSGALAVYHALIGDEIIIRGFWLLGVMSFWLVILFSWLAKRPACPRCGCLIIKEGLCFECKFKIGMK